MCDGCDLTAGEGTIGAILYATLEHSFDVTATDATTGEKIWTLVEGDGTALWTDDAWITEDNQTGEFTFDIDRVEMAWVNLSTEDGSTLNEGYTLATVYYITDDWATEFADVYSGDNALENGTGDTLSGWCGMYVVEVATETTDEDTGETTTTYSYYLFGYAYNDGYDGGAELHHYYIDDFETT